MYIDMVLCAYMQLCKYVMMLHKILVSSASGSRNHQHPVPEVCRPLLYIYVACHNFESTMYIAKK